MMAHVILDDERRKSILYRIAERIVIDGDCECWLWQGPTSGTTGRGHGYPRMSLDGRTVAVHRVVAVHFFGYLHAGQQIDHTCRNRLCLNPRHLEVVTPAENCRRRSAAAREFEAEA